MIYVKGKKKGLRIISYIQYLSTTTKPFITKIHPTVNIPDAKLY